MYGIPNLKLKKEIWFFLTSILIVHVAAYIIVPIFPLLLKNEKALATTEIGLIIGLGSLFIQVGSIIAGIISDSIGAKYTMLIGNGCQAMALLGLGYSQALFLLILFSILNGIGTGIYIPTTKAAISYIAAEDNKTIAFSLRSVASHIGISTAGLIVLFTATNINFYFAAMIYVFLLAFSWFLLPDDCGNQPCPTIPLKSYIQILKNKSFLYFSFISALVWSLHTQLAFLLPLRAEEMLKNTKYIGIIWTTTSIAVIIFQPIISKRFLEVQNEKKSIYIGTILIGAGITLLGITYSFPMFLVCGLIFILGEMFMMPTLDGVTSIMADPKMLGAYFAIANFSAGIGGAVGTFASGRIIDLYGITGFTIPWIIYGGFTLLVIYILRYLKISN
ncbi:MFS transporter [Alkaliphilus pronyensis]|uniref:MFS transporter n=1 Tax=Alkaliphilus pronyensis TaxID=1482732 RepID=A0A6I0F4Z9_9FIRM|nr:MFS transporter [Alkaliphilus pronyensis]KAB3534769.1 MFS transporter [Alkaliphilus pronyensis]